MTYILNIYVMTIARYLNMFPLKKNLLLSEFIQTSPTNLLHLKYTMQLIFFISLSLFDSF